MALFLADPTATNPPPQENYDTPIWRLPVGDLAVTPIAMVLDPDMNWTEPMNASDSNALLYVAAGRDGLWVMNASPVGYSPVGGPTQRAFRADDSGDSNPAYQAGRKWCNDVKILELAGKTYVLALFAGIGRSNLRIYRIEDLRNIVGLGAEIGNEIAPLKTAYLRHNADVLAANPNSKAYAFGMAVDEDEGPVGQEASYADVYIAMGEHGIFKVPLKDIGGLLQFVLPGNHPTYPKEHGPWFGAGSPYESRDPSLYGTVDYFDLEGGNPTQLEDQYCPFFLDVAVEDGGPGHHRLYAAVDHLGWCAFNLDAAWDNDIWSGAPPYTTAPGYPDFVQEGKRYTITGQAKQQIRLLDDLSVTEQNKRQSCSRYVQIVTTRDAAGQNPTPTLVVSVSRDRFIFGPGRMNDGRTLQWDLNLGPVRRDNYPANARGQNNYVLAYDISNVGDIAAVPPWIDNGQNHLGWSLGGWDVHALEEQPDGELQLFFGSSVAIDKTDEIGPQTVSGWNLTRVWYDPWPPTTQPATHTGFFTRGRFHRLGRSTTSFGPSKLDPRVLVTAHNDAGIVSDGPLTLDYSTGEIRAPFAIEAWVSEDPMNPISAPPNWSVFHPKDYELTYGIIMDPRGGFMAPLVNPTHEYRLGFHPRYIGEMAAPPDPTVYFIPDRWFVGRFSFMYDPGGYVDSVSDNRVYITPPANKFSVAPYSSEPLTNKKWWSGRPYYSTSATFEEYNAYVRANFSSTVDDLGIMFSSVGGSPQGMWALKMSKLKSLGDAQPSNHHVEPPDYELPQSPGHLLPLGALVTHPEYWNVEDVRSTGVLDSKAPYFIERSPDHTLADVQNWYPDMFQLPDPENPPTLKWVLAVPSGYIAFAEDDAQIPGGLNWAPDPPEFTTNGYQHMMVRLFDLSDPRKLEYVDPNPATPKPENADSPTLPAFTLIGPSPKTCAISVRGFQVQDPEGKDRYLMVVGDLSGKLYLYDMERLLDLETTALPNGQTSPQYGWFFTEAPLVTYQTQQSLSDLEPNGVYKCEVVTEAQAPGSPTYVYLAVPRIGIEVLELGFGCPGPPDPCAPTLTYIGRIQTPGNASGVFVQSFGGGGIPDKLLFVGDYDGGMRIYKKP